MGVHIHQIFYSAESRGMCDPGFRPLDNLSNERPDWREYWPIRNFLKSHELDESSYYGFLSPKFKEKTGLSSESVLKFIRDNEPGREVFLFSPFFDLLAFYQNVFDQGETHHPGLVRLSAEFLKRSGLDIDPTSMISCSRNSAFSNFVVARPPFWRAWSEIAEKLFRMSEDPSDPHHSRLNAVANYHEGDAQYKLFILERIASCVMQHYDLGKIKAYPLQTSFGDAKFANRFFPELMIMDSMKFCYLECGNKLYLEIYQAMRQRIESLGVDSSAKRGLGP